MQGMTDTATYPGLEDVCLAVCDADDGASVLGGGAASDRALDALERDMDVLFATMPAAETHLQAQARIRRLQRVRNRVSLALSLHAGVLEMTVDPEGVRGGESTVDWLRGELHVTSTDAQHAVDVGRFLRAVPQSLDALERGEISFTQLGGMAGVARHAAARPTTRFDERPLLALAKVHGAAQFRRDCADARHAFDAGRFLQEDNLQHAARSLVIHTYDDHVTMGGRFDLASGAVIRSALEPLARRLGSDDERPREQRLADALAELCKHGMDEGGLRTQPRVQVTMSLQTLQGREGAPAARIGQGGAIPAAIAQQFACDGAVQRVVFGPRSIVLDAGQERRVVSAAQRRVIDARDQGCVYRGCPRAASWTDKHHVQFWARDHGETDVKNCASLCWVHHGRVHRGEARVFRADDGGWVTVEAAPTSAWDVHAPLARPGPDSS